MNHSIRFRYFLVFTLLVTTLSCVIPGLSPVQPIPTADTRLDVIIAETVAAAQTQTQQASPLETATSTVIVPTITAVPIVSVNGTTLVTHEDLSAVFVDYKAGFELVTPAGWLAVRVNEPEYYAAYTLDVALEDPLITSRLTDIQKANLNFLRLDVIDIRDGHTSEGVLTYITVDFEAGDLRTLEEWEATEKDRYFPFENLQHIGSSYSVTSNGTRVLIMEKSWNAIQEGSTVYYRGVFFALPTGAVILDLVTTFALKDIILPEFEQVVNSLKIISP